MAWGSYQRPILRQMGEVWRLWLFLQEVECLLRVAQEHAGLVGGTNWTGAALCASEHIAQVYGELKRCHKAMRARALLREELRRFVAWQDASDLYWPTAPLLADVL